MKIYKLICLIFSFFLLNCSELLAQESWWGQLKQGDIVQGSVPRFVEVQIEGRRYPVDGHGNFLASFAREEKSSVRMRLIAADKSEKVLDLSIQPTKWNIQRINGLPSKKVAPSLSKTTQNAIRREQKLVREAVAHKDMSAFWQKGFIQPVTGRISGEFGGQRILNGQKKSPHSGVDIAAPIGTPVKASSDGKVVMASGNLFYTGNMIIINHGYGLQTLYAHLNKMYVKPGQMVKQGEIIGEVGKTGRATGPHLHWGASLQGMRFSPFSLLHLQNSEKPLRLNPLNFTK